MEYGEALNSKDDLKGRDGVDLLARMIYAEARGESSEGKRGVAFVAQNRKDHATKAAEFGGTTWEGVLLKSGQFAMTGTAALKPDTSSQAWADCLDIAQNLGDKTNPIGACLWFCTNKTFGNKTKTENGVEKYCFGNPTSSNAVFKEIVEKCVIGNHTFFRVTGY